MKLREGQGSARVRAVDLNATVIDVLNKLNDTVWYRNGIQLRTDETRGYEYVFTLRMEHSGCRGSVVTRMGHKSIYACWHTHRDVMLGVFAIRPPARLTTGIIKYNDQFNFRDRFPETYYDNVGSLADPCNRGDACRCDMGARAYHPSVRTVLESLGAVL